MATTIPAEYKANYHQACDKINWTINSVRFYGTTLADISDGYEQRRFLID